MPEILNSQYCQPILKFFFIIDSVPELNWDDGSQYMTLRCGKHLEEEAARQQLGENRANVRIQKKAALLEAADQKLPDQDSDDDLIPGS